MIDACGREMDHLRLSLTDHCNLACRYCVPGGAPPTGKMIDAEFAFQVVQWLAVTHAFRFVRLTGGEPLLYPGLLPLTKRIADLGLLKELTLTTNAQALTQQAAPLAQAGLTRINISLDTLKPEGFRDVTRGGRVEHTLAGIEKAIDVGLTPVKINVVTQRGVNDDEIAQIAEWGLQRGCIVRFLEVMPIGPMAHVYEKHLVPVSEILEKLRAKFELRAIPQTVGQPATDYAATGQGLRGVIGIIGSTTRPFCDRCRRLRVTSRGQIVACVHDSKSFDISRAWNGHNFDTSLADAQLRAAADAKLPEGPRAQGPRAQSLTMLSMGG